MSAKMGAGRTTTTSPLNKSHLTIHLNMNDCDEEDAVESMEAQRSPHLLAILGSGEVDMKTRSGDGTFLHVAVAKGSLRALQALMSLRVDLEAMDAGQNTALILAAEAGRHDIVRFLIKAGALITTKGADGMTVLHVAAKCGHLGACKAVLEAGDVTLSFINSQDDGGWTPLVWACENGHLDVVKYLASRGADVNIRDVEQNVALHWAAFGGSAPVLELLLSWRCDVNVANVHGDTPLHISAREDKYESVATLLARNADVFIINKNNESPLDCAPKDGQCFAPIAFAVKTRTALNNARFSSRILSNDISRGRELNPIQCSNELDSEPEPRNYTYIRRNCVSSDNVKVDIKASTVQTCSCEDRCSPSSCECATLSVHCWYDGDGRLVPEFNFADSPLIFECNDMCSCNAILCGNRLVQRPLGHRFQLFRTARKGWGIRALNAIPRGSYVCEYVGEILTDTEADHRQDDSYLFDLDNKETDSFCIDAKFYGNFARFINHSCAPNLNPVKVFIDHHDLRFPRIALFAGKDICAMEELSFDYGDKFWLIKYKSFTCDCGAPDCRYSERSIGRTLEKYQLTEN